MDSKYVHVPRTCECTLYGKRDFVDVIELRVLSWGDHPGSSRWAQCHHKGPYKREAGGWEPEEKVM